MPLILPLIVDAFVGNLRSASTTLRNFLSWAPRMALARLFAKWRSLLTLIVGVMLGAVIGAMIPLYSDAVGQVAMIKRLESEPTADAYSQLRISIAPHDFDNFDRIVSFADDLVTSAIERHMGAGHLKNWVNEPNRYIRTSKMGLVKADGDPIVSTRTSMLYLANWESHVRLVEGVLPSRAEVPDDVDFAVALPLSVADKLELRVGDRLLVDQRLENTGRLNSGAYASSQPFTVILSAIVVPEDESDAFWMALDAQESPIAIEDGGLWQRELNLLTTEAAAWEVATGYLPETDVTIGWRLLYDHAKLPYTRVNRARQALRDLEEELYATLSFEAQVDLGYRYYTRLVDYQLPNRDIDRGILQSYAREQRINNIPFALLLAQIGGLVLFFLIVTAALVRRSERREIAMLQSRGASDRTILALRGLEALFIAAASTLAAPFLAQRFLLFLAPIQADTDEFPLPLTPGVFGYSALAASITLVALTLTLFPVLRLPLISAGGTATRSERRPWVHRYYFDVMLAAVGLAFTNQLLGNESPLIATNVGEQRVDVFLLAAPLFLLLGMGSIALRLFPIVASFLAYLNTRRRGVMAAMATWQLSRDPVHYARLTFLLALAITTGWFATSFRATVRRSQGDQARYLVGTDIRLSERDTVLQADRVRDLDFYLNQSGIEAASPVHLVPNVPFVENSNLHFLDLLAVDPETFDSVTQDYWRADLGTIKLPERAANTRRLQDVGVPLPFAPDKIGLWARFDRRMSILRPDGTSYRSFRPDLERLTQRVKLNVRLLDDAGSWIIAPIKLVRVDYERGGRDAPGLGTAAHVTTGWAYYEADLTALEYTPVGDVRLVSFFWEHKTDSPNGERFMRLILGDIQLYDAAGEATPFAITDEVLWRFANDAGAQSTPISVRVIYSETLQRIYRARGVSISILFNQDAQWSRMGINANYQIPLAMDAVVSDSLGDLLGLNASTTVAEQVGDRRSSVSRDSDNQVRLTLDNVQGSQVRLSFSQSVEYFPGFYNDRKPFAIVRLDELLYAINQSPSASFYPDEVWLKFDHNNPSGSHTHSMLSALQSDSATRFRHVDEITFADEFDKLETEPLALGLLGLMFLAFIIALALSIVGLLTYASLTAQARRHEFGVLRALGLSSQRVVWSLLFEQLFVVVVAIILGSIPGYFLSENVVPTLALGATGEGVVPPFETQTEWAAIGNFGLIILLVLIGVFVSSYLLIRQMSLSRSLRLTDE